MRTARFRFPTRWEAGSTGPPASHRLAAAVMVFTLFPTVTPEEPPTLAGDTVTISADQGVRIVVDDVRYAGPLSVVGTSAGLGLTEATTLDRYLEGIAEVPFGWPEEALRAQAVAARTYLAWTLGRGRTSSGRRYGYDICATTQCQVYSGVGVVEGWGGDRWKRAVESTGSEILLHEGEPAQALYSSTSGGRTRSVEDVFPGASPTPYLRAVESPGEDSPFVDWGFELNERDMATLLREAGLLQGALIGVETVTTADGGGAWRVEVIGTDGVTSIGTWELRTALNRAAPSLEGLLPVMRPDVDRPYPQTILSPTFTIESYADFIPPIDGPPRIEKVYTFDGHGWGHLVGMSQFGAEAMARGGAGYAEILAHFYGGLEPVSGTGILPSQVVVGLATERDSLEVGADGPVSISLDGEPIADGVLGTWTFERAGSGVRVVPPVGLGLAPELESLTVVAFGRTPVAIQAWLTASAEVRVLARTSTGLVELTEWEVEDAGPIRWFWGAGFPTAPGSVLIVQARSPDGADEASVAFVAGAE